MGTRVYLDGRIVLPEDARVSVFDRQFLYGDGIYETVRTYGGHPFLLPVHLRRLRRSAASLRLPLPWTDEALTAITRETLLAAENPESLIRIMVTRGVGEYGLDPGLSVTPSLVILVRPLDGTTLEQRTQGVAVAVPTIRRNSPNAIAGHIKSGNYLNQAMALAEGKQRGAYEVVMLDALGNIAEGSTSNVFFARGGVLFTPSVEVGVLPGVTRAIVLGLAAQLGIPSQRGYYPLEDFLSADEAFLSASIKEILFIRSCDDRPIGGGQAGPLTRAIFNAYHSLTARAARGEFSDEEADALLALGGGEER